MAELDARLGALEKGEVSAKRQADSATQGCSKRRMLADAADTDSPIKVFESVLGMLAPSTKI